MWIKLFPFHLLYLFYPSLFIIKIWNVKSISAPILRSFLVTIELSLSCTYFLHAKDSARCANIILRLFHACNWSLEAKKKIFFFGDENMWLFLQRKKLKFHILYGQKLYLTLKYFNVFNQRGGGVYKGCFGPSKRYVNNMF
jgi:hypothetical protein